MGKQLRDLLLEMGQDCEVPVTVRKKADAVLRRIREQQALTESVQQTKESEGEITMKRRRKIAGAIICVAALAVAAMSAYAAVKNGWTDGLALILHNDEEGEAESVTSLSSTPDVSAEQNGITVRPMQVLADRAVAMIALEISGENLPKDRPINAVGDVFVSIDGKRMSTTYRSYHMGNEPAGDNDRFNKEGFLSVNGGESLELDLVATLYHVDEITAQSIAEALGWEPLTEEGILGKEISVTLTDIGYFDENAQIQVVAEGVWTISWTLTGDDTVREIPVDVPFETDVQAGKVTKVTISPLYMTIEMDWPPVLLTEKDAFVNPDGSRGDYQYWAEPPIVTGFQMNNGRTYTDIAQNQYSSDHPEGPGSSKLVYYFVLSRLAEGEEIESIKMAGDITIPLETD